jgi:8-oxo-dGTP pyrophosphatase MutT (NUDIX family)
MIREWQVESDEPLAGIRIGALRRVRARSPRTGEVGEFYTFRFPDWVNVIPMDERGRVVLIRQYRMGTREVTLEIPGGLVEEGETPEGAARRELAEETGFTTDRWRDLGWVHPNPAIQGNRCHTFLAEGVVRSGDQRLDANEDIEVVTLPLADVPARVRAGEIRHSLVIAAFSRLWMEGRESASRGESG